MSRIFAYYPCQGTLSARAQQTDSAARSRENPGHKLFHVKALDPHQTVALGSDPRRHHRIPESELHRHLYRATRKNMAEERRVQFRHISGRNQLVGRIIDLKIEGLLAQVTLSIAGQHITAIITSDAARELRLVKGQTAAALIKATEVMILRS